MATGKQAKSQPSKVNATGGNFPKSSNPAGSKTHYNSGVKNASGGNFPKKGMKGNR